jgi:hypothetical protein
MTSRFSVCDLQPACFEMRSKRRRGRGVILSGAVSDGQRRRKISRRQSLLQKRDVLLEFVKQYRADGIVTPKLGNDDTCFEQYVPNTLEVESDLIGSVAF